MGGGMGMGSHSHRRAHLRPTGDQTVHWAPQEWTIVNTSPMDHPFHLRLAVSGARGR
jgi:FtsP/CotA-like multicopper oxidase with cupredoxin domain